MCKHQHRTMKKKSVSCYQHLNMNTQTFMVYFSQTHGVIETKLFKSSSCLQKRKADSNLQLVF